MNMLQTDSETEAPRRFGSLSDVERGRVLGQALGRLAGHDVEVRIDALNYRPLSAALRGAAELRASVIPEGDSPDEWQATSQALRAVPERAVVEECAGALARLSGEPYVGRLCQYSYPETHGRPGRLVLQIAKYVDEKAAGQRQLDSLFEYVAAGARFCPMPNSWLQLWEMLPDKREVNGEWQPRRPLILSGWGSAESPDVLREQILWAAEHDALDVADEYLRGLPEEEWEYDPH